METPTCSSGHLLKSSQDYRPDGGCKRCQLDRQREYRQRMKADAAAFRQLLTKPSLAAQVAALAEQHDIAELSARLQASL